MIILSPEDAELLKMNDLQLAAKCLREGGAPSLADVCQRADEALWECETWFSLHHPNLPIMETVSKARKHEQR